MILNNNKNTGFGSISGGGSSGGGTGGVDKIYVDGLTNSLKNSKFDKVEYDATDNSLVFYANNVEKARVVLPAGSGREIELKYEDNKIKYKYSDETNFTELVDLSTIAGGGGTIDSDSGTMSAIGGIPAGTNLKGKTALEVLDMMFFPYTKPVVSSVTLNRTPTNTVVEVGTTVYVNSITANIVKKSKPITNVKFYVNNAVVENLTSGVSNGGSFTHTLINPISLTSSIANTYIKVGAVDDTGAETIANSIAITFVNAFYYGVVSDGAVLTETLIKGLTKDVSIKGAKSYTFNTSANCMCIAYDASYGSLTKIVDMNNFDITNSFTKSQVTVNSTTYNVYVSNPNSNSNFTVKFNF